MARRVYIPPSKNKAKDGEQPPKGKKQTPAVRAAALAMIRKTRQSIDPKILEAARKALPEKDDDVHKLFFGDKNLIEDETVPIDRKKNLETLFSFLENEQISESLRKKVALAMKESAV